MKVEEVKFNVAGWKVPVTLYWEAKRVHLRFAFNRKLIDEVKAMEGRKWDPKTKTWSVKRSERNEFTIRYLKGEKVFARYDTKLNGSVKPSRDCLYAHQVEMLEHILVRRQCVVAGEMGVGKTLSVIEALEVERPFSTWYVAPKSALAAVQLEFGKWKSTVWPDFMTYDGMKRKLEYWSGGQAPKAIVFDESSRLKNPKTKRWEYAEHLVNAVREEWGDEALVILMSGSPAPHDPTDWWAQCELACPGFLRESSKVQMRNRLAIIEKRFAAAGHMYPHLVGWRRDEVELLAQRLDGLVLVKLKKDCLDLPEKVYEELLLEPKRDVKRAAYLIAQTSENALDALTRLRTLSDGFQYEEDSAVYGETPKDEALKELLEQHEDARRLVIYAGFRGSIDKLYDLIRAEGWHVIRLDGRGLKTSLGIQDLQEALRTFQEVGDQKLVFLAQPGSGGMGITLTASPTIVYYSNDFNAESRIQSEDRIHRPGSRGATVVDLVHLPTDKLVLKNLKDKRSMQSITLGEVQDVFTEE